MRALPSVHPLPKKNKLLKALTYQTRSPKQGKIIRENATKHQFDQSYPTNLGEKTFLPWSYSLTNLFRNRVPKRSGPRITSQWEPKVGGRKRANLITNHICPSPKLFLITINIQNLALAPINFKPLHCLKNPTIWLRIKKDLIAITKQHCIINKLKMWQGYLVHTNPKGFNNVSFHPI